MLSARLAWWRGAKFVLRDDAIGEIDPSDAEGTDVAKNDPVELRGLHAKLYVVDQPYWSHIYTGSANATDAAFNANVEFLVEFKGRNTIHCAACLVDAPEGQAIGFGRLLQEFRRRPSVPLPEDEEAARALEGIAMRIGALEFTAEIGDPVGDVYPTRLTGRGDFRSLRARPGESLTIGVRPLSRGAGWGVIPWSSGYTHRRLAALLRGTHRIFRDRLAARRGAIGAKASFVVRAELIGEPADRLQRVLAAELRTVRPRPAPAHAARRLGSSLRRPGRFVDERAAREHRSGASVLGSEALLEPLMRTLAKPRTPRRDRQAGHGAGKD